jgi:hypothetical protein
MTDNYKRGGVDPSPPKFGCRLRRSHGSSPFIASWSLNRRLSLEGGDVPYHLHLMGLVKCVHPPCHMKTALVSTGSVVKLKKLVRAASRESQERWTPRTPTPADARGRFLAARMMNPGHGRHHLVSSTPVCAQSQSSLAGVMGI